MFTEILKFVPRLDTNELNKMERALSSRFVRVAKRFGKGIGNMFAKGGPIGIALGFLTKLLNPLKDIQETMDRTLASAGDIVTYAGQFNTTPGQLAKLKALGEAKGIEADALYQMISKFQAAIVKAEKDPSADSAVREFVGTSDMAEGFFEFMQSLQNLEKSQQILVQQQVFGEKQVLKMASFLQSDFAELLEQVAPQSADSLTKSLNNTDRLSNLKDILTARRNLADSEVKGRIINDGMIANQAKAAQRQLDRENKQLQSYQDLQAVSNAMEGVTNLMQEGIGLLGKLINIAVPKIEKIVEYLEGFSKSSMFRGLFRFGKGD